MYRVSQYNVDRTLVGSLRDECFINLVFTGGKGYHRYRVYWAGRGSSDFDSRCLVEHPTNFFLRHVCTSFEEWCQMTKSQRVNHRKQCEAAEFLGISLQEYHSMPRGRRISATRIKKHSLGLLGTKRTGSLAIAA